MELDIKGLLAELKSVSDEDLRIGIANLDLQIPEQKFQNAFSAIGMAKYLSMTSLDNLRMKAEDIDDDGLEAIRWNAIFLIWGYTTMVYMRSEHLEAGLDSIPLDSPLVPFKKYFRSGNVKKGEDTLSQHIRNAFSHGTFELSRDLHTVIFQDKSWITTLHTEDFLFGMCNEVYRFYCAAIEYFQALEDY